jgi:dolichyl-phosphate-mannose-protein mannosyltransferase
MQFANIFSKYTNIIIPAFIFILTLVVFGNITSLPNQTIWDETYFIPSVQKYLDNTFFMEAHPPLSKLIITAGEVLINPNTDYDNLNPIAKLCMSLTYIDYNDSKISLLDYRKIYPNAIEKSKLNNFNNINEENKLDRGYSYCGVRFMPTLFALFIPILIYYLILILTANKYLALFSSFLVIFENALITHYRAAMLDGIQMVFILLTLIFFSKIIKSGKIEWNCNWFLMLVFSSLALACKHNAVFLMIFPLLLITKKINVKSIMGLVVSYSVILLIYSSVFFVHINNGRVYAANKQDRIGYYNADSQTKDYLNKTSTDFNYFGILKSNMEYMQNHHLNVPLLDPTNPNENGSYPTSWVFMKKIINYNNNSVESKKLTLVGNPIIWALSLIAALLSIWNLFKVVFKKELFHNKYHLYLIIYFGLYSGYFLLMCLTSSLRVMYLYHYFIGFVLTFILLALNIKLNNWDSKNNLPVFIALFVFILIGYCLIFPFTYNIQTFPNYFLNNLF